MTTTCGNTLPRIDLGSVVAAKAVLHTFFAISAAWGLTPAEQQILLGNSRSEVDRWRHGEVASGLDAATQERISFVLNIYQALHTLLPMAERADEWPRLTNSSPLFVGASALDRMLGGQVGDLKAVADYLNAQLCAEFS